VGVRRARRAVFIYLGEAVFALPILHNTAWRLTLVAMVACALGRAHVPLGVALTNASRRTTHNVQPLPNRELRRDTPLAHLSSGVSVVLWWSGLRGGVAFALASASFGHRDFETHCGGLAMGGQAAHAHGWSRHCSEGSGHAMTDGLAIMQATLLVAATSIFALGGSIERVAEKCGVLKSPTPTTPTYSAVPTRNSRGRLLATTPG
jgi:sodium/hydrogen exchanger 8